MSDLPPGRRVLAAALVAVGGAAGSTLQYLGDQVLPALPATLAANALGSFALGVVVYRAALAGGLPPETRAVLATGFLSSFTTYSTFALQSATAPPSLAGLNVLATYALGGVGVLAGRALVAAVEGGSTRP